MVIITTGIKWRCCLFLFTPYVDFPTTAWDETWCDSALQSAYDYNQTAVVIMMKTMRSTPGWNTKAGWSERKR